jgi:hypothetical protein
MNAKELNFQTELYDSFDQIADKIGEFCRQLKGKIQKTRDNLIRRKQEREDLVKKCHPNGKCWPLHPDCPACQKIMKPCQHSSFITINQPQKKPVNP